MIPVRVIVTVSVFMRLYLYDSCIVFRSRLKEYQVFFIEV